MKEATPVFEEGHVEADGFRIRYLSAGEGAPLAHLHGGGGLELTPAHDLLARDRRVIAFEMPGEFVVAAARNGRLATMAARLIEDLERLFYLVLRRTDVVLQFPGPEAELFGAFDQRDEQGIRDSIAAWVDGAYANVLSAVHRLESVRKASLT